MEALLTTLESHEAVISSIVGIVTLLAAAWGFVKLVLFPVLSASKVKRENVTESKSSQERRFSIWASLVNRGIDSSFDLDDQISYRSLNACLIIIMGFAFPMTILSLSENDVPRSLGNLFLFFSTVSAYNLSSAGYRSLSRWTAIAGVTLLWNYNITLTGPGEGIEYWIPAVLILPLILFSREETRQIYIAVGIIILSLPLALFAETQVKHLWPFNTQSIPPLYYYGNVLIVAGFSYLAMHHYNRSADESFSELEDQEHASETLIRSLLPSYIAKKVGKPDDVLADWHSEVAVLYVSVTGFTELYKRVSAVQLLEILREIYSDFDELVASADVEKINTLGTVYVAATGIDPSRAVSTEKLAAVALGMVDVVKRVSSNTEHEFGVRIGVSTGDAVSGVISKARPSFDIWGKTVEMAQSIREQALRNEILLNESAYWRLKSQYVFEEITSENDEADHDKLFKLLKVRTTVEARK